MCFIFTWVSLATSPPVMNIFCGEWNVNMYLAQSFRQLLDILRIFGRYLWIFCPNLHMASPLRVNCKYFWIFGTDTCKLLWIWLIFENICPQPVFSLSQPLHLVWIRHWLAHLNPTVTDGFYPWTLSGHKPSAFSPVWPTLGMGLMEQHGKVDWLLRMRRRGEGCSGRILMLMWKEGGCSELGKYLP